MTQDNTGGPAFARGNPEQGGHPGMTLRDWFAGQALANTRTFPTNWMCIQDIADQAYAVADAMIAARNGGQGT